jgi:hypothetical protein
VDDRLALTPAIAETSDGPWLILSYFGQPSIRLDVRLLDRIFAADQQLILELDPIVVVLSMASSAEKCAQVATELGPYTRAAPITREDALADAKRRLDLALKNRIDSAALSLYVGELAVTVDADTILLGGRVVADLLDIAEAAQQSESIALRHPDCVVNIQAALVLLVAAARDRPAEDPNVLMTRIAAYEGKSCAE